MQKIKQYVAAFVLCVFAFTFFQQCKKYPDDDVFIQWKRVKKRIVGRWDPRQYLIDGEDSLSVLKSKPWFGIYHITPPDGGSSWGNRVYMISQDTINGYYYEVSGHWGLHKHKKIFIADLRRSGIATNYYGPYGYTAKSIYWEIKKLTETEMWLSTIFNDKTYFVKFVKI